MLIDQLVGRWQLLSCEAHGADGEVHHPFGLNPVGLIAYEEDGSMSVQVMGDTRARFSAADKSGGTAEEIRGAFSTYEAYFGTYEVNEADRYVTHRISAALFPNWVGSQQRRSARIAGSRLTLQTPPLPYAGRSMIRTLVWERVGA
jgi:hypothetical protein